MNSHTHAKPKFRIYFGPMPLICAENLEAQILMVIYRKNNSVCYYRENYAKGFTRFCFTLPVK